MVVVSGTSVMVVAGIPAKKVSIPLLPMDWFVQAPYQSAFYKKGSGVPGKACWNVCHSNAPWHRRFPSLVDLGSSLRNKKLDVYQLRASS